MTHMITLRSALLAGHARPMAATLLALLTALGSGVAMGESTRPIVNEQLSHLEPAIEELRREEGHDRRVIVEANMLLTNSEKALFWPLYDDYRIEYTKVIDERVRLITDFVAQRETMSENEAQDMTRRYFAIARKLIAVKEKHATKMSKVLSARTVARFFNIDETLDVMVELTIAARVPLMQ